MIWVYLIIRFCQFFTFVIERLKVVFKNWFCLTHSFPMHPFSTPWKHQKNRKVFWCFLGVEKGFIWNERVNKYIRFCQVLLRLYYISYFSKLCLKLCLIDAKTNSIRNKARKIFTVLSTMSFKVIPYKSIGRRTKIIFFVLMNFKFVQRMIPNALIEKY